MNNQKLPWSWNAERGFSPSGLLQEEDQINEEEEAAAVELAVGALPQPQPKMISDQDVMSALLDKEITTKAKITHALAVDQLGSAAYTRRITTQKSQISEA